MITFGSTNFYFIEAITDITNGTQSLTPDLELKEKASVLLTGIITLQDRILTISCFKDNKFVHF
jgi:hypothetical protein